jgi:hypothetical protein
MNAAQVIGFNGRAQNAIIGQHIRNAACGPMASDQPVQAIPRRPVAARASDSYFPLSAADRFVVGIAAPSELSFETGMPLLANPGGGWGVDVAWEGSVEGATGVPLCPSPVLDSL